VWENLWGFKCGVSSAEQNVEIDGEKRGGEGRSSRRVTVANNESEDLPLTDVSPLPIKKKLGPTPFPVQTQGRGGREIM